MFYNIYLGDLIDFSTGKKPKHVKMVKVGQICVGIFLKIQSDIYILLSLIKRDQGDEKLAFQSNTTHH